LFGSLSDRLAATFKGLRGKGRLSEADIDATVREIRTALLEADVALPVVRSFTARVKERALSEEVSGALNPAQQVVKIVHGELVDILGGETSGLRMAKTGPTFIMLSGLQGRGQDHPRRQARRPPEVRGSHAPVGGRGPCSGRTPSIS
jgi:Signal recognition particle GTPase